jgi:hypothetical protein
MRAAASLPEASPLTERGFEIKAGAGVLTVTLWGDLGLGWFARLATALALRGISIRSAQAVRRPDDTWRGSLELDTSAAGVDPETLDYQALAITDVGRIESQRPRIERFRLERTETGALSLRLFGADRIGLLSGLLERMEFLGLFPERLRITTSGDFVDDTIWLRGVAGYTPSPGAEHALVEMLTHLRHEAGASA